MNHTGSDLIRLGADAADQIGCNTVADVDTENNGEHGTELDADRTCHRLQDTDNGR